MRINIRQLKSLSWLACALALGLAGYTFWDIFQGKKVEKRYDARLPEYYHELLLRDVDPDRQFVMGPTSYDRDKYERIWLARIDGSVKPAKQIDTGDGGKPAVVKEKVPKLEEVVQVGMVLWSTDPMARIAAVEYIKDPPAGKAGPETAIKAKRLHLTQGEPLSPPWDGPPYNGRLLRIEPQEVVFQWEEGEVTISPGLAPEGGGVPIDRVAFPSEEDVFAGFDAPPEQSTRRDDGSWIIGSKDRVFLEQGGGQQVMEGDVTARSITPSGGGRSSIELLDVKPGSMPARFGFQSGDRILSVNGHPMNSVAEAMNWGKNNPDEPAYHVVWERKGVAQETTFHWKPKDS